MLERFKPAAPVFFNVTVWGGLRVPTACEAKVNAAGLICSWGTGPDVPDPLRAIVIWGPAFVVNATLPVDAPGDVGTD
jgi:hypothetical protein